MEAYVEQLVKCKTPVTYKVSLFCLEALAVGSFLAAILGYTICFLGVVVFGIATYILFQHCNKEYEYLYVNKEFTVDRILSQSSRKQIAKYDITHMEVFAPENSSHLLAYESRDLKVFDFSAKDSASSRYVMILNNEGKLQKVILEASEELYKCFYSVAPRQVFNG